MYYHRRPRPINLPCICHMDNLLILGGILIAAVGWARKRAKRRGFEQFIQPSSQVSSGLLGSLGLGEPPAGQDNLVKITVGSGRVYLVQNLPQKEEAAEMLDRMFMLGKALTSYCKKAKIFHHLVELYPLIEKNPMEIKESWPPPEEETTSFTMRKASVSLCIRDQKGLLHREVDVAYPYIHEVGHIACPENDHVEIFWAIFRVLQSIARANGFWDPGASMSFNYCRKGMAVNHQMPDLFRPNSPEYIEMIADIAKNEPHCLPPLEKWKKERKNNRLIQAIAQPVPKE